jgi:hypothetical protein
LNLAFKEEVSKSTGVPCDSIDTYKGDAELVKKVQALIVGQGSRYPTDIKLDLGEKIKYERMFKDFKQDKLDLNYTNEILLNLGKNNLHRALQWI